MSGSVGGQSQMGGSGRLPRSESTLTSPSEIPRIPREHRKVVPRSAALVGCRARPPADQPTQVVTRLLGVHRRGRRARCEQGVEAMVRRLDLGHGLSGRSVSDSSCAGGNDGIADPLQIPVLAIGDDANASEEFHLLRRSVCVLW